MSILLFNLHIGFLLDIPLLSLCARLTADEAGLKKHAGWDFTGRKKAFGPLQAAFPRRWLLDPALSPFGATYGYSQLQKDESGELFAVLKLSRFYLTEEESGGFQVQSQFATFWKELVQSAKDHSVSRLLVDLSGNPGGFVDFAYLFVRAIHPLLQFAEICNEYDRPIGSLFEAWKKVNVTPLAEFLKSPKAAEKRLAELSPEKKKHLTQILRGVSKACIALDVLNYDDMMMIQSAMDTLEIGEMDSYTLQETVQVLADSAASFGNPFTLFLMQGKAWHFCVFRIRHPTLKGFR